MDPVSPSDRTTRVALIFSEVVELEAGARASSLEQLCRNDTELREEVESLLLAFDEHAATVRSLFQQLPLARPDEGDPGEKDEPSPTLGFTNRTIGRYRVLEKLGGGGMGVVYLAHDQDLDRTVALKFLPRHLLADDEAKTRFRHEAKAASALDHVNICTIHDIGETDDDQLYISMTYYRGETLRRMVARGPIAQPEALGYALQVTRGLEKAHAAEIVHRDIKPANLLVTDEGVVKILDFGIAKIEGVDLTRSGAAIGTIAYMSPEQVRGDRIDQRTDVWSLGAVLFEMITGSRPFQDSSDPALIYSILNAEPDFDAIEDSDLRRVVEACLAKNPDERFASVSELADALSSLAEGHGVSAVKLPRRRRKISALTLVASLIAATVLVVAIWFLSKSRVEIGASRPERQMLLVLPFENLGDSTDQYFADGMAEELSTRLASVKSLGLISRNTANHYRGTDKTVPEIGQELGVDYVIGGTVRWSMQSNGTRQVRITPYLTRVSDDVQVWAETYDRGLIDVLDLQRDVALQIVDKLEMTLDPEEVELVQVRLTDNADAYQEYLKGLEAHRKARLTTRLSRLYSDDVLDAIEHFQAAVTLDSLFADAAYMLARSASGLVWQDWYIDQKESPHWLKVATDAAARARRAAPGSRADLLANGYLNFYGRRDFGAALALFTQASDMTEDTDALEAIAEIQTRLGNFQYGIDYLERVLKLDPQRADLLSRAASLSSMIRRYDKELEYSDRARAIEGKPLNYCGRASTQLKIDWNTVRARQTLASAPEPGEHCHVLDFFDHRFQIMVDHYESGERIWFAYMVEAYRQLGMKEQERKIWEDTKKDALAGDVQPEINKFGFLAVAEAGLGNRDEALAAIDTFRVLVSRDESVKLTNYNTFASFVYVRLGMRDELIDVLESEASRPGFMNVMWLSFPWFDPVRDDPRFQAVLEKFKAWERGSR